MPRKSTRGTSGSSPEKPTPRRTTRRGRKTSEEPEEAPLPAEILANLLRASDESSEESDNDSDYGSPKKGRGRGKTTRGKKKDKEPQEEKATPARRGRARRAIAKEPSPEPIAEEPQAVESVDVQEIERNKAQENEEQASEKSPESEQTNERSNSEENEPVTHDTPSPVPLTSVNNDEQPGKVSDVTIEQDTNIDQAPVNEEDDEVERSRENIKNDDDAKGDVVEKSEPLKETPVERIHIEEKIDEPQAPASVECEKAIQLDDEESKDLPESSGHQSDSNASEKFAYRKSRTSSSSNETREESEDKMEVDTAPQPIETVSEVKEKEPVLEITVEAKKDAPKRISRFDKKPEAEVEKPVVEEEKPEIESEKIVETPTQVEKEPSPPAPAPTTTTQRKRKWTSRKTDDKPVIAITTDSLKNIISEEVKPVPLADVKLLNSSPEREPEEKRPRTKPTADDKDAKKKLLKERLRKQEEEENRRTEQLVKVIEKNQSQTSTAEKSHASNGTSSDRTGLLKDRKVSIVVDEVTVAPPSPPKHESSSILYITNLVRPFTVLQLKSLLVRTGKIVENGFWIDKIKSKCYVKYETEDEAVETRHALHGVTWPSSNPKCLHVDFGKESDMEKAILSTLEEMPRIQITAENRDVKEEKDFGWSKDPYKNVASEDRSRISHSNRPVREWDVGKKEKDDFERDNREKDRRKRSSEREKRPEKRRSMSNSPGRKTEKVEADQQQPVRLLDDLFRKTKATPCLYWLPLSAEQIQQKEEQRQKNIAEHERRMEELRKEKPRDRRRSRSNSRRRSNSRGRRRSVSRDRRYRR